ncbi:MAG: FAD binding domain-containing protein [Bdellovibrio sp.]|nr:FAD binding domain-containing protein [Bdellovibrio sp.]
MKNFEYIAATSLKQAEVSLSQGKDEKSVSVIAGGTDLLGTLKDKIHPTGPEVVVDLKTISGLSYVKEDKAGLHIGALTTLREIATNKSVTEKYSMLAQAARSVASPQIRNMGTIGGNICQEPRCWYYRAPDNQFHCLRKGGIKCGATHGDNRYHSIFGGVHVAAPACTSACPGNVEIATYMGQVREGEIGKAAETLLANNPIPAMTGRVCPHLCESSCNRGTFDESVSIRQVERFLGDYILENSSKLMKAPKKQLSKKIAIVGAGPAGLSAAYYLRKLGYKITVFDKMPEAGGMLRYCIPGYRLPNDVVRKQITALEKMGIVFELNVDIGSKGKTLKDLKKKFSSVFLATGTWEQKSLKLEKSELLTSGMDFLVNIEKNKKLYPSQFGFQVGGQGATLRRASSTSQASSPQANALENQNPKGIPPGDKVLVIGGGNVAVDVAISALRLGAKEVTMACLEDRKTMPAFPEDIEHAVREGINLMPSFGPHKILESNGKLTGMEFVRCSRVFDENGCFNPSFDLAQKETVEADRIILAIGQATDLGYVGKSLKTERGLIVVDNETKATSQTGIFAGGDVTSGPSSVIQAIASGRKAATSIDAYLAGKKDKTVVRERVNLGDFVDAHSRCYSSCDRAQQCQALTVRGLDQEDYKTLDVSALQSEVQRCMNCSCVAVNASDLAPALVALDAKIRTTKQVVSAADFFSMSPNLDQNEIVKEIEIPANAGPVQQSYLKFRIRNAIDFPIVSLASVLNSKNGQFVSAKLVLGAVAPIPLRIEAVEKFLKGKTASEEVANEAGEIAVKNAKPLAKNKYKLQIVKALIKKAILENKNY